MRSSIAANSGPRWLIIWRAPASRTLGGRPVGPGIRRLGSKRSTGTSSDGVRTGRPRIVPRVDTELPPCHICRHMGVRRTTILADGDLLERLDRFADRGRTTKTAVIIAALEAYLAEHDETPGLPFLAIGKSSHGRLSLDGRSIARREAGRRGPADR